jgi:hypothetical protein
VAPIQVAKGSEWPHDPRCGRPMLGERIAQADGWNVPEVRPRDVSRRGRRTPPGASVRHRLARIPSPIPSRPFREPIPAKSPCRRCSSGESRRIETAGTEPASRIGRKSDLFRPDGRPFALPIPRSHADSGRGAPVRSAAARRSRCISAPVRKRGPITRPQLAAPPAACLRHDPVASRPHPSTNRTTAEANPPDENEGRLPATRPTGPAVPPSAIRTGRPGRPARPPSLPSLVLPPPP